MSYLEKTFENFKSNSNGLQTLNLEIPEYKWDKFKKLMRKLDKMSKSFGISSPKYDVTEEVKFLKVDENQSILGVSDEVPSTKPRDVHYIRTIFNNVKLTLPVDIKPIEGWEMIGVINHKEELLKPVPGKEFPKEIMDNVKFSNVTNCDHCGKSIYRNKTVIVRNEETNEYKEVGGTCIKNYLGIDYVKLLQYIESIHSVQNELGSEDFDGFNFGGRVEKLISIKTIIKFFIWMVKNGGYVSKKGAETINQSKEEGEEMVSSTSDKVVSEIDWVSKSPNEVDRRYYDQWVRDCELFEKRVESISDSEYQEVIDFIENDDSGSSFMFNVKNIIEEGAVTLSKSNFITGVCSFYFGKKLAEEAKKERSKESSSTHIGEVGQKYSFNVVVKSVRGFETAFGYSHVYNMEDENGNIIVKFGTINPRYITNNDEFDEVDKGAKLRFSSDVKEHSDFRGIPQTIINRISKYDPKLSYL